MVTFPAAMVSSRCCFYLTTRGFNTGTFKGQQAEMIALAAKVPSPSIRCNTGDKGQDENGEQPSPEQIEEFLDVFLNELGGYPMGAAMLTTPTRARPPRPLRRRWPSRTSPTSRRPLPAGPDAAKVLAVPTRQAAARRLPGRPLRFLNAPWNLVYVLPSIDPRCASPNAASPCSASSSG